MRVIVVAVSERGWVEDVSGVGFGEELTDAVDPAGDGLREEVEVVWDTHLACFVEGVVELRGDVGEVLCVLWAVAVSEVVKLADFYSWQWNVWCLCEPRSRDN